MNQGCHPVPNLFVLILSLTTLAVLSPVMHAEPNSGAAAHPLAGTWELERAEVALPDGKVVVDPNYGPEAKGLLIVDRTGRYSLQVFRPDRPKFASGDKARGTADEYMAAMMGISTHTGRIEVDTAGHKLVFHIELAAFPNWEHTQQTRSYQLADEVLTYRIPPRPGGNSAISVWRRVAGGP